MKQKIAIIGAGLSGLVTAKTLREYRHDVTVFEKEDQIGGVWCPSRHYPGLTTQNTRDSYAFTDFRMPRHYPEFPNGGQMFDYLTAYVVHFGVGACLRLGHKIDSAAPVEGGGWRLKGVAHGSVFEETFDFLVICNGTFSEPFIPPAPGREAFEAAGGRVLHTTQVKDPALYRDKHVVVVGYGKSACDVASAVAPSAASVHLVYRQAKWKVPKLIKGINYKYFILTRFGEALTKLRYRNRAERLIHALGLPNRALRSFQGVFARQQQLEAAGLLPDTTIQDLLYGELSVESDNFFRQVREGKITALKSEIREFHAGNIELTDGARLPADLVVYGTGFVQDQPFLPASVRGEFTDAAGNFHLYRNILPVRVPNLAFVGYNTSFFCNLTSEMAALWLAEHLEGRIALPHPEEMETRIREHLDWRLQFRPNGLFRNASVYPFNVTYVDWLLKDMNARLPFSALLSEWWVVIEPGNYEGVKKMIRKKSGIGV